MRALALKGENFKRLSVVEISLAKGLNQIVGKNGQGKTSTLDLLAAVLGGKDQIQWEPIRKGADHAIGILDLGDDSGLKFRITRKFRRAEGDPKKTYTTELKIEDAGGKRIVEPQSLLNALLGPGRALDPIAFANATPADRVNILKSLVPDFDFDAKERERDAYYDERTAIGREVKRLKGVLDTYPAVPAGTPDKELSAADIAEEQSRMVEHNGKVNEIERKRSIEDADLRGLKEEAEDIRAEIEKLQADLATALSAITSLEAAIEKREPLPKTYSASEIFALRDKIAEVEAINALVRRKAERKAAVEEHSKAEAEYAEMTAKIEALDQEMREAIEGADFPVAGLSLGDNDVLVNGLPFDQASDAEQLRKSMAIAMAVSPDLRLIRIRDGNGIDSDGMKAIAEVAAADDYQIIMERVEASAAGAAILIEDGTVKKS